MMLSSRSVSKKFPWALCAILVASGCSLLGADSEGVETDEVEPTIVVPPPAPSVKAPEPEAPRLPDWRFLEVEGAVRVDGKPAAVGMEVSKTAKIVVGKKSNALITVGPGSVIELRAGTKITMGTSKRKKMSVKLLAGVIWSFLDDGTSYEVVTDNAVSGVRGTVFFVKKMPKGTYVCDCLGDVDVTTPSVKKAHSLASPNKDHNAIFVRGKKGKIKKDRFRFHTNEEADVLIGKIPK